MKQAQEHGFTRPELRPRLAGELTERRTKSKWFLCVSRRLRPPGPQITLESYKASSRARVHRPLDLALVLQPALSICALPQAKVW